MSQVKSHQKAIDLRTDCLGMISKDYSHICDLIKKGPKTESDHRRIAECISFALGDISLYRKVYGKGPSKSTFYQQGSLFPQNELLSRQDWFSMMVEEEENIYQTYQTGVDFKFNPKFSPIYVLCLLHTKREIEYLRQVVSSN